ncbi:hypothetical protein DMUE_4552 [Dictyocoela muelleri]|nr:hypothetical protein DMUE_4552 [Dictyocoela muelleri]
MEEYTKGEFKKKNLKIDEFMKESSHFKQLFLNEHDISIPLSWRLYTGIKDNREANYYLNDLIKECYRLISKIKNKSKIIEDQCKLEQVNLKTYLSRIINNQNIKGDDNHGDNHNLNHNGVNDNFNVIKEIKILNDELNKYIVAVRDMELLIWNNNGYIRHELVLDRKFILGKYYVGISQVIDECYEDLEVKNYYKQFINEILSSDQFKE